MRRPRERAGGNAPSSLLPHGGKRYPMIDRTIGERDASHRIGNRVRRVLQTQCVAIARIGSTAFCLLIAARALSAEPPDAFDLVIRGGLVHDGSGAPPKTADIGIVGDAIRAVGDLSDAAAKETVDARGRIVAPGFINVLSWATDSLIENGLGESDIRQGVTLEVFGEGWSMGPLNESMRRDVIAEQGDIRFDVPWTTLGEYLAHLERRGVAPNVASFVGATTVRIHELGYADRPPTDEELDRMRRLVRDAMEQGALGIGSSLIYAPASYSTTEELIALCREAAAYDGIYVSHLRSEGDRFLEGVDELITIAEQANIAAEIYHLKAAGEANWPKFEPAIAKVEAARGRGLGITANMYPYTAGSTGLSAAMPPWVQEGGFERWRDRLRDASVRTRVAREMREPPDRWENLLLAAGSPDRVLLVGFRNPDLKHLTGMSLGAVARRRGVSAEVAAMDLVIEDGSRVDCVYFLMSEENVRRGLALPWVAFGSDSAALSPSGVFLKSATHPRAYGCFARLLGKYVRDERIMSMESAIHRMTGWPARTLGIRRRGLVRRDYFADLVVFDAESILDKSTYETPHQFATGMRHVVVNGRVVLRDGEPTEARPGRFVRGPGVFRTAEYRARPVALTDAGREIHRSCYVFDGHNDLPWALREKGDSSFDRIDIARNQPELNTDIARLRSGNVGAQYWSVYVPAETRRAGTSFQQTLEQIDIVHAMVKRYPDVFELARTAADVERIQAAGKVASLIGVEGGHSIEDSVAKLRRLHELGARYMTLTHSETLDWADAATDTERHQGLTPFGEEVVREMNRLAMLVDLSHVSPATMRHAMRVSRAPVIFSHSSARAVADHPRNVPDDVLRKLSENGGIVMVNFFSGFVVPESAERMRNMFQVFRELRAQYPDDSAYRQAQRRWQAEHPIEAGTIHNVVDHIEHLIRTAGVEHVGIGSDFDGIGKLPKQLDDVAAYPLITQELLNRGYTADEIRMVMHDNMLRVLRAAERTAASLRGE